MMKRLAMIVCASTLFAGSSAQAMWEGNWLFGAMGGYAARNGDYELNIGHPAPTNGVTTVTKNLDEGGFIWGLLAGYQVRCNSWLVGGEINVDWRDLEASNNYAFTDALGEGWNGSAEYKQNTVVGLTARIGYEVTPCFLPYIRLGVETSDDRLNVGLSRADNVMAAATSGSRRQYRFVGGVGAEVPIPAICGLTFRLEYNYYSQGKGVDATGYASDNLTYIDPNAKANTNAGKASLVFNFM